MASANVFLKGGRVTQQFQAALFDAANKAGMSVNEFVLVSTGERLVERGISIPGVFHDGDVAVSARAA